MREINLTRGKIALVDNEDYDLVISSGFKWMASTGDGCHFYAFGFRGSREYILMHRLIMGAGPSQIVDHADGNGLNNCRSNLRLASPSLNQANRGATKKNRSGFKGVRIQDGRYRAEIRKNKHSIHLGYFDNPVDAAKAYNRAASELFGDFARLNLV